MMALARMVGLTMVALLPGGMIVLFAYFLARAVHHGFRRTPPDAPVSKRLVLSVVHLKWKDLVREATGSRPIAG